MVIPAYNCERYVAEAIETVLGQDYAEIELIIVNDGSTDGTLAICEQFGKRVHIITQKNQGVAAARNTGIRAANGSIIGFLDADDLWTDDHVSALLPYLGEDAPYDFARGRTRWMQLDEMGVAEHIETFFEFALVGACLYRASVFDAVGLFDERMRAGEDFDWNIRLSQSACREKRTDKTTLIYRRNAGSLTSSSEVTARGLIDVARKALERSRRGKCAPQ